MTYEVQIQYCPHGVEKILTDTIERAEDLVRRRFFGITTPRKAVILDNEGRKVKEFKSVKNWY